MKKILNISFVLIVFCLTTLLGSSFFISNVSYAEDSTNKVEIATAQELKDYMENFDAQNTTDQIVLTADINMQTLITQDDSTADVVHGSIGTVENPFTGTFDGRGYSISNLRIDVVPTDDTMVLNQYVGLFGYVNGAVLKNVSFEGEMTLTTGKSITSYVGALVGRASNSTVIENVQVVAKVNLESSFDSNIYFGMLAGMVIDSDVSCVICRYTRSTIDTWTFSRKDNKILYFGGVVGSSSNTNIIFAVVSVKFDATIESTFAGNLNIGGVVGSITQSSGKIINVAISNTYYITNNAIDSVNAVVNVGEVAGEISRPVPTSGNISYIHFKNNTGIERFGSMGGYSYSNANVFDYITVANEETMGESYFSDPNNNWHPIYGTWDTDGVWYFNNENISLQSFYGDYSVRISNNLNTTVLTAETQLTGVYRFGDSVDIKFAFNKIDDDSGKDMSEYYSLSSVNINDGAMVASITTIDMNNDGVIDSYRISGNDYISITKNENDNGFTIHISQINRMTAGEYNVITTQKPFEALITSRLYKGDNADILDEDIKPGYVFYAEGVNTNRTELPIDMFYGQTYRVETSNATGSVNAFVGWYLQNPEGEDVLVGSDKVLQFVFGSGYFNSNCEIYAKYVDDACVITFNIGENSGVLAIEVNGQNVDINSGNQSPITMNVSKTASALSLEIYIEKEYDFNVEQFITDLDVYKTEDPTKTFCKLVESNESDDYKYYSFQLDMTTLTDDFESAFTITCNATPKTNNNLTWIWIVVGCVGGVIVLGLLIFLIVYLVKRRGMGGGNIGGGSSFKKKNYKNMYF